MRRGSRYDAPMAPIPPTTLITLMRHGPTDWNLEKRIQGQTQTDLSDDGRKLCRQWAEKLRNYMEGWAGFGPMNRIVCSDLHRAGQTAEILVRHLELPVSSMGGLGEQDWGEWTGRRIRDLRSSCGDEVRRQEARGWDFRPPGGESRMEVWNRASGALRSLAAFRPGEHILVVTHKGVLKCLLYRLLGMRFLPEEGDPLLPDTLHTISVEVMPDADQAADRKAGSRSDPHGMRIMAMNQQFLVEE